MGKQSASADGLRQHAELVLKRQTNTIARIF